MANSRNWSMTHDLAGGTTNDVTYAFLFNPAGQAVSRDISNPNYQFAMPTQAATAYTRNGLNQYNAVGGTTYGHDLKGNLTSDGVRTYTYDVENRLIGVYQGGVTQVTIAYDPLGRIKRTSTPTVVEQYLWDGDRLVGTIDGSNVPTGRWLHGPGPDEPLAQLLSARRWLLADHQGSITAETDAAGTLVGTPYTYDPYGRPDATHGFAGARFRYTGQTAIVPTVPLWHYKARVYDPGIGRFLQTDPIGYEDSLNLYQYVGNDPLNDSDPTGLCTESTSATSQTPANDICKDAKLLTTSKEVIQSIIGFEGVRLSAYQAGGDVPTIGIGHTQGVQLGDTMSRDEIVAAFQSDIAVAEDTVRDLVGDLRVSQREFDALTDLAFNVGATKLNARNSPDLNAAIAAGDYAAIGDNLRYTSGRDGPSQGLVVRSNNRQNIFRRGDYSEGRQRYRTGMQRNWRE